MLFTVAVEHLKPKAETLRSAFFNLYSFWDVEQQQRRLLFQQMALSNEQYTSLVRQPAKKAEARDHLRSNYRVMGGLREPRPQHRSQFSPARRGLAIMLVKVGSIELDADPAQALGAQALAFRRRVEVGSCRCTGETRHSPVSPARAARFRGDCENGCCCENWQPGTRLHREFCSRRPTHSSPLNRLPSEIRNLRSPAPSAR